jgi:plastocyanin
MTRLAGITSLYALIAALLLATPLSASEDPDPAEPAPVEAAEEPQDTVPESPEPAPTAPEEAPAEPPPAGTPPAGSPPPGTPPPPVQSAPVEEVLPEPSSEPVAQTAEVPEQRTTAKRKPRRAGNRPRATAAADTGVTISDFRFAPRSITIDVGDTVTWTNEGPTAHSATADDGSFDTGVFEAGETRSETFNQAGTLAYFCTPHPNMRGTITVRAASTGGGPGDAGDAGGAPGGGSGTAGTEGGTSGTGTEASGDSSGSALPDTGLDAGGLALLGLLTLGLGAVLRRGAGAAE